MALAKASADKDCKLLTISQTLLEFKLCNLEFLNITTSEYNLISDPPLFTDIGDNYISLADINVETIFSPEVDEDGGLHLNFHNLDFDLGFDFQAYGISDMSRVFTNTVHYMANLIGGRFSQALEKQYPMVKKEIEDVFADLFDLPPQIDLGNDLQFTGGFVKQPVLGKSWGSLPITYYLDSVSKPNPDRQTFQIPYYDHKRDYQLQLFASEFGLNSIFYALQTELDLNFSESELFTTTEWKKVFPDMEKKGFADGAVCQNNIAFINPHMNMQFKEGGAVFYANFKNHLKCAKTTDKDAKLEDIAISENQFTFDFNFGIEDNVVLKLYLNDIDIQVTKLIKDFVSETPISIRTINDTIYLLEQTLVGMIDLILPKDGVSLDDLLCKALGVKFLGIEMAEINFKNGYFEMLLTPEFTNDPTIATIIREFAHLRLKKFTSFAAKVLKAPKDLDKHTEDLDDFSVYVLNWLLTSKIVHYSIAPFFQHVPKFMMLFEQHYGVKTDL